MIYNGRLINDINKIYYVIEFIINLISSGYSFKYLDY